MAQPTRKPFLANTLRALVGDAAVLEDAISNEGERAEEWRRRHDGSFHDEGLVLRISVPQYKLMFERNTEEVFLVERPQREGGGEVVREAEGAVAFRGEAARSAVRNNGAMKGLSKEDVEGANEGFGVLVREGLVGGGEGEEEDGEEMEE